MSDQDKAAKKLAKAQAKIEKKRPAESGTADPAAYSDSNSPAARSAAAAERQVKLQLLRVLLALLMLIVAVGTFLITAKPWQWIGEEAQSQPPAQVETPVP